MRVLFAMRHTGSIRNYQSTLAALAGADHELHLVFTARDKRGGDAMLADIVAEHPGVSATRIAPAATETGESYARMLRTFGDYLRYLLPPYDPGSILRRRVAERLPAVLVRLADRFQGRRRAVRLVTRAVALTDRGLPVDPNVRATVESIRPDVLLVTPYVEIGSSQCDFVKSARALGIPTGLCVSSWDNLTNKGVIRIPPDMVMVWNDAQKTEAVDLHGLPPARVRVTGAQSYDQWYTWRPSCTREEFCRAVGLLGDRPFVTYLCSSAQIAPYEVDFVRRWITALRGSPDEATRTVGVLVRPHPYHFEQWRNADLSALGDVTVYPRKGENPTDALSKNDYFNSLFYCAAVVGINTSGLIEAGILERPVFTIKAPEFADTQDGVVHFHHLVQAGGGLLHVAETLDEHVAQIRQALADDERRDALVGRNAKFLAAFVRPHGLDQPATPRLVAAIEELAGWRVRPQRAGWLARAAAAAFLRLIALAERRRRALAPRARSAKKRPKRARAA